MKENEILGKAKEPIELIMSKFESWYEAFIFILPNLGIALLVMVGSYFLSGLVYKLTLKATKRSIEQVSVQRLVARVFSIVVVLLGLFLALGALNLSKTLTGLLSAAGVSGIVIGFALQGTLANTVSGIVLSFRKNLALGNWIETSGYSGEVTDINLN